MGSNNPKIRTGMWRETFGHDDYPSKTREAPFSIPVIGLEEQLSLIKDLRDKTFHYVPGKKIEVLESDEQVEVKKLEKK